MNRFAKGLAAFVLAVGVAGGASANGDRESERKPEFTQVKRVHGTIVDVAVGNPAFSTLVTALQAANLVPTLQGPGPFTVFAPTNDAFAQLPPELLNLLLANPQALTDVLLYHVVPGARDFRFRFSPKDVKSVQGQDVFVDREKDLLQINNAFVSGNVIRADNGWIYVIDSVLLPQYRAAPTQ